jgi:hypothetical protein
MPKPCIRHISFNISPDNKRIRKLYLIFYIAIFGVLFGAPSWAKPVIFNQPSTAKPGDIISVNGSGFGSSPRVYLKLGHQTASGEVPTIKGENNLVVFQIPKDKALDLYEIWVSDGAAASAHVTVNGPRATQFDSPDIASGGNFRIFGRNLYVNNVAPKVTFVDANTNASLAAVVTSGDAYRLWATAPGGIVSGKRYKIRIESAFGATYADQTLLGRPGGADYFGLGAPWGADFVFRDGPGYKRGVAGTNENDHHIYDVTNDPALSVHAKGDGVTDAMPAIQAAINLAKSHGGGIVYFPPGTYRLASKVGTTIALRSGVVLKGHSASDTKIVFGPTTQQDESYRFTAFWLEPGTQLAGFADLSMQNIDKSSQQVANISTSNGDVSRIFIQRVNWDLGSGKPIFLQGDRIAIENSTFRQAINSQVPRSNGDGGLGPIYIARANNFILRNNTISWSSGFIQLSYLTDALIEGNHFTRGADQIIAGPQHTNWPYVQKPIAVGDVIQRTTGRQISVNFSKNLVIHSNTFDTSGNPLKGNWNDGETILSEGGGGTRTEDAGTVTAASALTVADNSRCSGACSWNYYPNAILSIVSGAGAGQIRHIVGRNNNTFTVDEPWDITPSPGDHFAIAVPSFENVLIRYNTMTGNPAGVVLWASTFLNVSIVSNNLIDNGGIYLRPDQRVPAGTPNGATFKIDRVRNIEIIGNTLQNTKGLFESYIAINYAIASKNSFWGASVDGVEVRNNRLTARPGTPAYWFAEGYANNVYYQNSGTPYVENGTAAVAGTIFQGNWCVNCPTAFRVATGVRATVIWNTAYSNSAGIASTFLEDKKIYSTAANASTGTIVGRD